MKTNPKNNEVGDILDAGIDILWSKRQIHQPNIHPHINRTIPHYPEHANPNVVYLPQEKT